MRNLLVAHRVVAFALTMSVAVPLDRSAPPW